MTYRARPSAFWWVRRRPYVAFVLRELSSIFVAWFVVYLLLLVRAVDAGPEQYQDFLNWTSRPWAVALNVIALLFVLLHAVTWFRLAPQALVVRLRGRPVPPRLVVAANYALWAVVSVTAWWVVTG
jgi:fumarate reductase subunit C